MQLSAAGVKKLYERSNYVRQAILKNINMSADDFHRACQIGLALRIVKVLKIEKQDFENMPIEEIEKFVSKYGNKI